MGAFSSVPLNPPPRAAACASKRLGSVFCGKNGVSVGSHSVQNARKATTCEPRVDIVQYGHNISAAKYSMLARLAAHGNAVPSTKRRDQTSAAVRARCFTSVCSMGSLPKTLESVTFRHFSPNYNCIILEKMVVRTLGPIHHVRGQASPVEHGAKSPSMPMG